MKPLPYPHPCLKHHLTSVIIFIIFITFALTGLSLAKSPEPGSLAYKLEAAKVIDQHITEHFSKNKLTVPKQAGDEKVLRRTYLALVGRIPTLEEIKAYTSDTDRYKRDMLAQRLLNSPGYNSHMANYYFDLFRAQDRFTNNQTAAPYQAWLRQAVETNKPWDKLVHELITAKGSIWQNGAVGYYIRDKGMELDNLANTMRLFTGTRMECAQCHDHPYNDMERMDFYRLAAFSNGFKSAGGSHLYQLKKNLRDSNGERTDYARFVDFIGDNTTYSSRTGDGVGRIKLPYDYQYNDGDPHEFVGARTPFEKSVRMSDRRDGDDGIKRFSKWMIQDNRRFTSVIVNRMWKRIMGTAIYTPADEYIEAKKTLHPKLMEHLIKVMRELEYDLKQFQHILLLTDTYGQQTSNQKITTKFYDQNGRQLRRLSAEQIWDSFVTLKNGNPDKLQKRKYPKTLKYRGKLIGTGKDDMATIAGKVLSSKSVKALDTYLKQLHGNLSTTSSAPMMMKDNSGDALTGFVRASEIASPAPAGHMLREFGQSDRELIQNSSAEANVNQVLSILNGHVEKLIVSDKNAHVYKSISKDLSVEQNITNLFLSTLTRKPSKTELILFKEEIAQSGQDGYKNILAALLTSREFLFLQ